MRWRIARKVTFNEQVYGWRAMRSVIKYLFKRSGVLSMPTLPISAFAKTKPELSSPDLQIQVFLEAMKILKQKTDPQPGVTLGRQCFGLKVVAGAYHLIKRLRCSSYLHNLLETEGDRNMDLSMKLCRQLMEANAMSDLYECVTERYKRR